jgi:hypothetical protein
MKRVLPFILVLGFITPFQPAEALGCASPQKILKNSIDKWSFTNSKGIKIYLEANKAVLTNPKCFSSKDVSDFKKSVKGFLKQCNDPKDLEMSEAVYGKSNWKQFCTGMRNLVKYTK